MATFDWIEGFLEENPELRYQARRPQTALGASRNVADFWSGRYGDVWGGYMGAQARQLEAGVVPTQRFGGAGGYLEEFPFLQRYLSRSRSARGEAPLAQFAPRMPWAY